MGLGRMSDKHYTEGAYASLHEDWHVGDSEGKARLVEAILAKNALEPKSICDLGCGAGEVLRQLHAMVPGAEKLVGYDISPQALALASTRQSEHIEFREGSLPDEHFDLALALDVVEHVGDYIAFLTGIRDAADHCVINVPLELYAWAVIRLSPLLTARRVDAHLHYFSRETFFESLRETGHIVDDWQYHRLPPPNSPHLFRRAGAAVRSVLFARNPDFAVRLLGGWSLLVLTHPKKAEDSAL